MTRSFLYIYIFPVGYGYGSIKRNVAENLISHIHRCNIIDRTVINKDAFYCYPLLRLFSFDYYPL